MRNTTWLSCLAVAVIGLLLTAANAAAQARILKIVGTGNASVTMGGQASAARETMELPLNAEVTTTTQEVYIEVIPGVVSTIKRGSTVRVATLTGNEPALELRQGSLVTQIDKKRVAGKTYSVKTAKGVAAARGTSFTVSLSSGGFTIATTADAVTFTPAGGSTYTIQAGMITITPPGATTPGQAIPLATAVAQNPDVAGVIRDAVSTAATVVQNNLGAISADSATNILSQVVAVAVGAMPTEAASFTQQAVSAVTAPGSATAVSPEAAGVAAGAITASAIKAAPDQVAQIAGAAAQAAPSQAGVITAVAQQLAPASRDAIAQQVASVTGQSAATVQTNADASATQAANAVNLSNEATSNVVPPPNAPATPAGGEAVPPANTPVNAIDPSIVSPAG